MTKRITSETYYDPGLATPAYVRIGAVNRIGIACKYPLLCLLTFVAFMSLSGAVSSQESSFSQNESSDNILRVNANLVILNATVVDRHNALVSGLDKGNFQVYENHILQPIKHFSHEDIPVTVGLVIDNSGSMKSKHKDVIAAGLSFANSSNPLDQIFVVNFNEHVTWGLPADTPFTDQRDQLRRALSTINTTGETALYDAIAAALGHLKLGNCDKKVLIVVSDGGDNASKHSLAQVTEMAKSSDAIIYAIGVFDEQDKDQNPGVLKRFAKETGGEAYFPQSSTELASICETIARDIRNQYTLSYVPAISRLDGGYRNVEVKASSPKHGRLSVRTRTGYLVPLALPSQALQTVGHDSRN